MKNKRLPTTRANLIAVLGSVHVQSLLLEATINNLLRCYTREGLHVMVQLSAQIADITSGFAAGRAPASVGSGALRPSILYMGKPALRLIEGGRAAETGPLPTCLSGR